MSDVIRNFEDLDVWQQGIALTMRCYALVAALPSSERYELSAQMRRCAVSIPANIAEGHARRQPKPFLNHVNIARGSLAEWITYLIVAQRQGFISSATLQEERREADRVAQMLHALARSLERRIERLKLAARLGVIAACVLAGTWLQGVG